MQDSRRPRESASTVQLLEASKVSSELRSHCFDWRRRSPVESGQKQVPTDGLRDEVVHPCRQAAVAIFRARARRDGDHPKVTAASAFPRADTTDDLEAVELGHVEIEQQRVELPALGVR